MASSSLRRRRAARVIVFDPDDRVLLINQYRHPVRRRLWEIPAGKRDVAGEPPELTAARELEEEVGRQAGQRAIRRLNPGRLSSGQMPVVFDPRVGGSLISHFAGAISGNAIARRSSFLLDHKGGQVFRPGITIHDDPLRRRGGRW